MNVMIPIWDWAVKSQSWVSHDFSLTQHHTMNTILKDMQSHFCHSLPQVLKLCCETFLSPSIEDQKYVAGFTELIYRSSDNNVDYNFCSNGMTGQISCTLTMMAMNAFVQHRFYVFFLYQTNKPVSYWKVIILVETMQLFKVSPTNLIQFVNCLLWAW